jgi:glycosyltransferase involved in cell wall biosynthesis
LIWRSLTFYGRIKYHYLLPVYRFFGRAPEQGPPPRGMKPSSTLSVADSIARKLGRAAGDALLLQVAELNARVNSSKGAIIFLPSSGWNIVNTQRSKHLAREFARQGYVSIYDSGNSYDAVSGIREVEHNVFLFREDRTRLAEIQNPIIWALTFNYDLRDEFPARARVVYDWIDDLRVFRYDSQFLEENHRRALNEADHVFCSARLLHQQAGQTRPDAVYLPNAVDVRHFANPALTLPRDRQIRRLIRQRKPIAGYYGALAEWFDYDLLCEVACAKPDWNFLLIGPRYDSSLQERGARMLRSANVHWLGPRSYDVLPSYLRLFDAAMIPFVINDITLATSPLKLFEYLALGKKVVATPLPECQSVEGVTIAANALEFGAALEAAKNGSMSDDANDSQNQRIRALVEQNSWEARVRAVIELFEKPDARSREP